MGARNNSKRHRKSSSSGNTNGNRPQSNGSSGAVSNSRSSVHTPRYTSKAAFGIPTERTMEIDGHEARMPFNYQENRPTSDAEQREINPLMQRRQSAPTRQDPEVEPLDYVDEEPLQYADDLDTYSPQLSVAPVNPPTQAYQAAFDPNQTMYPPPSYTGKDPATSYHNYSLGVQYLEVMYGMMEQLNAVVAAEQDDHLHGILLGAQAGFDVAYAHVHRELASLTGETDG